MGALTKARLLHTAQKCQCGASEMEKGFQQKMSQLQRCFTLKEFVKNDPILYFCCTGQLFVRSGWPIGNCLKANQAGKGVVCLCVILEERKEIKENRATLFTDILVLADVNRSWQSYEMVQVQNW